MLYLNQREEKIIGNFMLNGDMYSNSVMLLKWDDGSTAVAKYCFLVDDENDCDMSDANYEEFWSFVFEAIQLHGHPPICVTKHNLFEINYHNFPDKIIADGKKIN